MAMVQPQVILLREGTDQSQGKGQLLSNISAVNAIVDTVRSTLGPRGMDKLIVDKNGKVTISNDGATIMKLLDVVHPAARSLVDIARSQDAEVGDGTTSVVVFAGELLKEVTPLIEDSLAPNIIIRGFRTASRLAINKVKELAVSVDPQSADPSEWRETLMKCAATAMSSKLISSHKDFFKQLVVDAVLSLDQEDLNERLIGMKSVSGGALQDTMLVQGVAFKKTFSYAGFEQQPKRFQNVKVLCLNVELELKAEKDNAEVRIDKVGEYQAIVDAEWKIIFDKLDQIVQTGAKVVLSKLPIGDLATQYFADRDIFCAGRVSDADMQRVVQAVGGSILSSTNDMKDALLSDGKDKNVDPSDKLQNHQQILGYCDLFEEKQIGSERYNVFTGCKQTKTCTIIMRGGAEQFIAEVERSLHDAIMIVRRAIKNRQIVAGGGAIEMELSKYLREYSRTIHGKQQLVIGAFAKALEVIPRQICDNAGFDATDILNKLRQKHHKGGVWYGVDVNSEGIEDNMNAFVWEPAIVKVNILNASAEAACLLLSVDETVKNPQSEMPNLSQNPMHMGRGRGVPRR
ncbi:hypothetical protein MIR68_001185 [Amoeboaphelidium protococcarum]|nr:hypothetical protein MIR68_001185 [Amoeboaphelidium protococcarum]